MQALLEGLGRTALHLAIETGNLALIEILMDFSPGFQLRDSQNRTVLAVAASDVVRKSVQEAVDA